MANNEFKTPERQRGYCKKYWDKNKEEINRKRREKREREAQKGAN